jgi:hypothetical protein
MARRRKGICPMNFELRAAYDHSVIGTTAITEENDFMINAPFAVILLLQRQVWTVFGETVLFALLGVVMFGVAFWLIAMLSPFSIRKELEVDHNISVAIVIAAVIVGIAIIVASAIHG